ncbi:hypothetical protein PQX77_019393 [Marasmius sp. AFHP31]|nr:hypothetical protein PQX77_019393 [Marasmius sp. AFHP31]
MPKGSKAPKLSSKPKDKLKAPKASQPTKLDGTGSKTLVDDSAHEAVVPPRRRMNKSLTHTTHEDSAQRKPPQRATKSRAKEAQIWMDPDVGARKGKGATDAYKALKRERALSSAEEASKAKRVKAALEEGRGIPKPSEFDEDDSDNDIVMGELTGLEGFQEARKHTSRKNSAQTAQRQVLKPKPVAQTRGKPPRVDDDDGGDSSSFGLNDNQSDTSEDSDGNIGSTSEESDVVPISDTQFSFEQATIIKSKKPTSAKNKKPVQEPSDDDNSDGDHVVERSSSIPPNEDYGTKIKLNKRTSIAAAPARSSVTRPTKSRDVSAVDARPKSSLVSQPSKIKTQKTLAVVTKVKATSKRIEAHEREQPVIKPKAAYTDSDSENEQEWSVAATAVASPNGSYNLSSQPATLRKIIEHATFFLLDFVAFKTLYPDYSKPALLAKHFFLRACKFVGKHRGASGQVRSDAKEIHKRFDNDEVFLKRLAKLVTNRFSQFRSRSKTIANIIVPMTYGLENRTLSAWSAELVDDHYVYARDQARCHFDGNLDLSAPYQHRAIKSHLQMWLIEEKGNGALAVKHEQHFKRLAINNDNDNQTTRGEVSIPLVAASAAAIHVVIDEKKSGLVTSPPFNEEVLCRLYTHHVKVLTEIQINHPQDFCEMMSDLYAYVRNPAVQEAALNSTPIYQFNPRRSDEDDESGSSAATGEGNQEGQEAEGDEESLKAVAEAEGSEDGGEGEA